MISRVYVVMEERYKADGFTVEENYPVRAFPSETDAAAYIFNVLQKKDRYSYLYHNWIADIPYDE